MGLELRAMLCLSCTAATNFNATNEEKTGICAPAMPSPSGLKHPGHPVHHISGIKRLLAAMPVVVVSIFPTPSLPRRNRCVIFLSQDMEQPCPNINDLGVFAGLLSGQKGKTNRP